jgi:hypothetical protein
MAELRLMPLDEVLSEKQLHTLEKQLKEHGIKDLPLGEDVEVELDEALSEDQLTDFMDRLEAHDLACDLYLPVEFEGRIKLGDQGVGSAYALLDALEEIREELGLEEEEEEEEEEELDLDFMEEQLHYSWRTFLKAANTCVEKRVPLHIVS